MHVKTARFACPSKHGLYPIQLVSPKVNARHGIILGKEVLHRAPRDARAVEGSLSLSFGLASVRDEIEEDYDNYQNETC